MIIHNVMYAAAETLQFLHCGIIKQQLDLKNRYLTLKQVIVSRFCVSLVFDNFFPQISLLANNYYFLVGVELKLKTEKCLTLIINFIFGVKSRCTFFRLKTEFGHLE